jgi:hypothetical protein
MKNGKSLSQRINFTQLTQSLAAFLLIVAEVTWVSLWYRTLLINYNLPVPGTEFLLIGLMLAAYLFAILLQEWRLVRPLGQAILVILLLIFLVLATRILIASQDVAFYPGLISLNPFVVITVVVELWVVWRGVSLAKDVIQPSLAWRRFVLGLFMILGNMLIINRLGPGLVDWGVFTVYLIAGLAAIIMARVSYAGVIHGLKQNPFDRYWIAVTFGFVGGVVLLSTILAALLTGQFSALLAGFGSAIKLLVQVVVFIILLPGVVLGFIFLYVIQPLGPIMEKLFDFKVFQSQAPDLEMAIPEPGNSTQFLAGMWPEILRGILFWGIILLLAALIVNYVRQKRKERKKDPIEADSENMLREGEARVLILNALQDAFEGIAGRFRPAPKKPWLAEIRRIYARLLAVGAELETPRRESQTPREYLPDLKHTLINFEPELDTITQTYQEVRYGELPEEPVDIQAASTAIDKLEQEGRRLKSIRQALLTREAKQNPPR